MAAVSLFPQKILVGEDVTENMAAGERTQVLQRAANLVKGGVDASELEFHDTVDDAVAVLVYVTIDAKGERIQNEGIVLFADENLDAVNTGEYAEVTGFWIYPVPKSGLFVNNAQVEYIRRKKELQEA